MNLDQITILLGQFGPYQRQKYFMMCLFSLVSALHALNMVFVGAEPKYHCKIPEVSFNNTPLENLSAPEVTDIFLPGGKECRQYDVTERMSLLERLGYNLTAVNMAEDNTTQVTCNHGYTYATDEFGRRPMFLVGVLVLLIAGVVASLAPNMYVFLPMYFCQGAAHTGAFLVAFTLSTELVGPDYRVVAGFVIQIFYGFGYVMLAGLAYFIREWRYLELAITLPAVLFGVYYWLLPESIPWLLSRGRDEEAEAILNKAAKQNGVTLQPDVINAMKEDPGLKGDDRQYFFVDCLRTWSMAMLSLNIWFNWLVNSFVFYGISLNSENLSGDPYLNFSLIGGVGVLSYVACLLFVNKTGRRPALIGCMVVGGVACIVAAFLITKEEKVTRILVKVFTMLGKFCIAASYAIIYLMAAELFPTVVRNIGMGVASMSARVGGIFAPFVLDLKDVWGPFPLLVFGVLSIIAGLLALFLSETTKKPLPQTLDDVKDRGHGLECLKRKTGKENRVV